MTDYPSGFYSWVQQTQRYFLALVKGEYTGKVILCPYSAPTLHRALLSGATWVTSPSPLKLPSLTLLQVRTMLTWCCLRILQEEQEKKWEPLHGEQNLSGGKRKKLVLSSMVNPWAVSTLCLLEGKGRVHCRKDLGFAEWTFILYSGWSLKGRLFISGHTQVDSCQGEKCLLN